MQFKCKYSLIIITSKYLLVIMLKQFYPTFTKKKKLDVYMYVLIIKYYFGRKLKFEMALKSINNVFFYLIYFIGRWHSLKLN